MLVFWLKVAIISRHPLSQGHPGVCCRGPGCGPGLWSKRLRGHFPGQHGGVVAGGRSFPGYAACAAPRPGTGEGPGSRVPGQDGATRRWLLEAPGSPAAGRRHLQVGGVSPEMEAEMWLVSC